MHEWISSHLMDDCTKTINYFFCTIHHMRELGSCYFSPYEPGRVTYYQHCFVDGIETYVGGIPTK